MDEFLKPLPGHAILLVLLQLSALLATARIGSELVRRLGLPSVVGELAAGIVLGPTVFGHYFPEAFAELFPPVSTQFHLLEIISWLGMILLLLLTGLETDVRLLRNLGRTAFGASLFGMIVPFVFGFALGWFMPDRYVAAPEHRTIFSLFLATAMSISAMPVIAKILLDLDLTRRNIGVVILSAGVVDDTTGWLILSLIAGAATTGTADLGALAFSLGGTAVFLLLAAFVLYPVLRFAFRIASDRFLSKDTDLVLMIVVTLLCAAVTEILHVHAVFGAFVAGCVIRQVPRLREDTRHLLESVTFAIFAPVFFGIVGLKVDLWKLESGSMLLNVLGVATAGKLIGCTVGSLLGGLTWGESLSIAVAMNARGAMELVVATIGLSLGILNQEMYSIVVMVAVTTSFMAPVLLRLTMKMVSVTDEEAARMAADQAKGLFDPEKLRVLVPTAGGPNALVASSIAMRMVRRSAHALTVLYVERVSGLLRRVFGSIEGKNLAQHLDAIRAMAANAGAPPPEIRRQTSRDVVESIAAESAKGYDLMMVGASESRRGIRGEKLEKLVAQAPCHVAIVKHRGGDKLARRLLVPIDGSFFSRVAVEFAIRYAEGIGDESEVTMALVTERDATGRLRAQTPAAHSVISGRSTTVPAQGRANSVMLLVDSLAQDGGLEKLSPVFKATKVKTRVIVRQPSSAGPDRLPILTEANSGHYDMVVLGAEHRAIHYRLFFGYDTEKLVDEARVTVVLVVPKLKAA